MSNSHICECGLAFKSDLELFEHEYSYFHGQYEHEVNDDDNPRNIMS